MIYSLTEIHVDFSLVYLSRFSSIQTADLFFTLTLHMLQLPSPSPSQSTDIAERPDQQVSFLLHPLQQVPSPGHQTYVPTDLVGRMLTWCGTCRSRREQTSRVFGKKLRSDVKHWAFAIDEGREEIGDNAAVVVGVNEGGTWTLYTPSFISTIGGSNQYPRGLYLWNFRSAYSHRRRRKGGKSKCRKKMTYHPTCSLNTFGPQASIAPIVSPW